MTVKIDTLNTKDNKVTKGLGCYSLNWGRYFWWSKAFSCIWRGNTNNSKAKDNGFKIKITSRQLNDMIK